MAMYVNVYTFTDQGMRAVKESPDRLKAGIAAAEAAGVRIHGIYYTEGPFDLVVVSETDNEKAAIAVTLGIAAQGNVRCQTMRAWTPDEFAQIVAMMP